EDFGGIFSSQSKIDGWVLDLNIPMYDTTEFGGFGHPNLVCGTIGAIRNNDLGIAGVAGGNYENTSDLDSSGCALFGLSMGTTYDTVPVLMDYVAAAIVGSSIYNPSSDYGYGLHVMNNSWGLMPIDSAYFLDTNITLLRDAYHFANRQQVTVVASSGNFGDLQDTGAFVNAVLPAYPAAF